MSTPYPFCVAENYKKYNYSFYFYHSEFSMASGRNQAIAHPRTQDNLEDPTQNDEQLQGKEDEEQEDKEKTENDYLGFDRETVIKVSSRN